MSSDNTTSSPGDVTQLLQRWADDDASALEALWPMVYADVRRLARRQMAGERELAIARAWLRRELSRS